MTRWSKSDWLDLGLRVLVDDGVSAIRINNLCEAAGRTKGSFYHHFKDRDAFIINLLDHWEKRLTANVISQTDREADPMARIYVLNRLAGQIDAELERVLRRWAGSDDIVAHGVARVDKRRVDYLAKLWHEAKNISSREATDLAVMNYASMVGFQQMYVPIDKDRRQRVDKLCGSLAKQYPDRTA